jgi:hypothetical protein
MMKLPALATLALLTILTSSFAENNVFFQNVHKEPKTPYEDPEDFLQIKINDQSYRSSSLGEWKLVSNLYSMDMVALHPDSIPGHIGLRVETLSEETQPLPTALSIELLDQYVLKLFPTGSNWDEVRKNLKDFKESVEFNLNRAENNGASQTHLKFILAKNEIWIMTCESTPQNYSQFEPIFSSFTGTFSKEVERKSDTPNSNTAKLETPPLP